MSQDWTSEIGITHQVSDTLSILLAAPPRLRLQTPYLLALWEELISRLKLSDRGATLKALKAYNLIHPIVDNVPVISELAPEYSPQEVFNFLTQQVSAIDHFCAHILNLKNLSWKDLDFTTVSVLRFVALEHGLQEQDFPHSFPPRGT